MPDADPRTDAVRGSLPPIDVLVRTFNSAATLRDCLAAVREHIPVHRLIVMDRNSTDATAEIAREFGGECHFEEVGNGFATMRAIELAGTENILFVDSDVKIVRPDFYGEALRLFERPGVGAVVGGAVGHPFLYGLPLGLTLLRRDWARKVRIPPTQQGQETYFLRRQIRADHLRVAYVADAMAHRSIYRGRDWPEFQGANTRIAAGLSPRELLYSLLVVLLIHANSRSARNLCYTPIFYLKFLRGFLDPPRWEVRDRRRVGEGPERAVSSQHAPTQ